LVTKSGLQPMAGAACFSFNALTMKKHNELYGAWCKLTSVVACCHAAMLLRCYADKSLTTKSPQDCMPVKPDV